MKHEAKSYDYLIGQINGLSEKQLQAHFELYRGYVKKLNEIEEKLSKADPKLANYSYAEWSELERRKAVPFNGAFLHELYFENLTGKPSEPDPELKAALEATFSSFDQWWAHTKAGLISAPGWVLVVRSRRDGTIRNNLVEEHHRGILVEQDIILALDGWEHAYTLDYGIDKSSYVQVLEKSIDWSIANRRFQTSHRSGLMAA